MDYSISRFGDSPRVPFDLDGRILTSSSHTEMIQIRLSPGQKTGMHTQPFEVDFFVLEGKGTLVVGDKSLEVSGGDLVRVFPGLMRDWQNNSGSMLELLVIKLLNTKTA